jgi:hypothetical protein
MSSMVVGIAFDKNGRVIANDAADGRLSSCKTYSESDPLISEGLGCMKHQVPEMRRAVERHGLTGVRVRDNGSVELTSRGDAGRRGLLRMRGLVDNDGGYGD